MPYKNKEDCNANQRKLYKNSSERRNKSREYQRINKDKVNKKNKEWRERNPEKVRKCILNYYLNNKEKCDKYRLDWQRENRRKKRLEAIKHYGGKCVCCGEDKEVFLAFDHINGGGNKHHKLLRKQGLTIVRWIFKNDFPNSIQLLCHNCNYAKYRDGICPHKLEHKKE